jgi:hypothetical protein
LYRVWKNSVVALLAVAEPVTRLTSLVVSAVKAPFEAVLHFRSAAGLVTRAGAPGDVFVAVQNAAEARKWSVHAALALTVKVGPVVALKPASKSAGVGAARVVEPVLTWSRTTLPAVIETLPGRPQLAGLPDAVHCAPSRDGPAKSPNAAANPVATSPSRVISPSARFETFRKTWFRRTKIRPRSR